MDDPPTAVGRIQGPVWVGYQFTIDQFVASGKTPNRIKEVCERIQSSCKDEHKQFESEAECVKYMTSLPHHDPICQHKFGPQAVQGQSFMCKFLHHFMAPMEPHMHCYHAGKGLADVNGKRKYCASS